MFAEGRTQITAKGCLREAQLPAPAQGTWVDRHTGHLGLRLCQVPLEFRCKPGAATQSPEGWEPGLGGRGGQGSRPPVACFDIGHFLVGLLRIGV